MDDQVGSLNPQEIMDGWLFSRRILRPRALGFGLFVTTRIHHDCLMNDQ